MASYQFYGILSYGILWNLMEQEFVSQGSEFLLFAVCLRDHVRPITGEVS